MIHEKKTVLVTVKAYPNPSKKYGETVCVAGIDLNTNKWIRLYPIPYRDLDDDKKFPKYSIIEVMAAKSKDDHRPESYKVDADSIKVINHLDTGKKRDWEQRKKIVLPTVSTSMCEILKQSQESDLSLGTFKPRSVDFIIKKAPKVDEDERQACYAQLSFLNRLKNAPEAIPFDFRYRFFCEDESMCSGHNLQIIDWEIGQAYRDWGRKYKPQELLLEKIKEKWLAQMCSDKRDTHFFIGNMKRRRDTFMVLGVFYPPKL